MQAVSVERMRTKGALCPVIGKPRRLTQPRRHGRISPRRIRKPEDLRTFYSPQIESVQSRQLKETQRVYQAVAGKSFVPEIDDHLDRESVYREFRQITDASTLTQSSVLGVLNETLPAEAVIVAAAGSLPGDLQRVWRAAVLNVFLAKTRGKQEDAEKIGSSKKRMAEEWCRQALPHYTAHRRRPRIQSL